VHRLAAFTFVVSLIAAAAQQQEIPRFSSGVDVVQFTVTVLDKDRHPVTGLTASDFDVLVDGKPRPLAAFAAVTLPAESSVAAAAIPRVAADVTTNRLPPEGRLLVIVMDRSIRNGEPMRAARAIANAAIDRLGPFDVGAVVYTASGLRMYSQGLTTDRGRLRAAVGQNSVGALEEPPPPPSIADFVASRGATPAPKAQSRVQLTSEERSGQCDCGVCVPDTLTALAKTLTGGMTRHKSILFVGSDLALTSRDATSRCAAYIYPARDRLTRALDEANVTFHVVDPRGLEALSETAELESPIGHDDMGTDILRKMILEILPDYTGGRAVTTSNRPEAAIGAIFDEDRSYYVLAIARDPAVSKADDRHRIKIGVNRSDVTVRTRNLYFAADSTTSRKPESNAAAAALAELLPRADFSLQMNLVPQFSANGSAEVRVLLGVDAAVAGKLDVLIRAFDRVFTPVGEPLKQRLDVPPGAVAGSSAFQWTSVLKLAPGDCEVRAAVATADGARAASVIGYVDVPDGQKAELALSGIVVKGAGAPTLRRTFARGEPIALAFQVARAKTPPADVVVSYRLRDDLDQALMGGTVSPTGKGSAVDAYDLAVRAPDVAGRYVLTITASNAKHSARRDLPVTVH
jgi:VWFA-related protein